MNNTNKPSFWKFGLFYFNKEDQRIFPPKRFGLGWTVNFANPVSIIAFLMILTVIVLIGNFLKQ
ncbi:DUF5808 domain-containing protein [Chryseobacterium sp. MMS23-Vi53]|uniref:DUF5808 domain-containing protein n=1 Tax=Chryseobacterium sp. MMS23-Vi53 TaxID=3386644 RepID=UPI0039EAD240